MANYRTAQGKALDMSALAARNERVRAVGNMKVNARGDQIDSQGKVIVPVNKRVAKVYEKTVSGRAVNSVAPDVTPDVAEAPVVSAPAEEEFTAADLGFDDEEDAIEIETIKAEELKKTEIKKK